VLIWYILYICWFGGYKFWIHAVGILLLRLVILFDPWWRWYIRSGHPDDIDGVDCGECKLMDKGGWFQKKNYFFIWELWWMLSVKEMIFHVITRVCCRVFFRSSRLKRGILFLGRIVIGWISCQVWFATRWRDVFWNNYFFEIWNLMMSDCILSMRDAGQEMLVIDMRCWTGWRIRIAGGYLAGRTGTASAGLVSWVKISLGVPVESGSHWEFHQMLSGGDVSRWWLLSEEAWFDEE
jgi:hypothetical protein